MIGRHISHYDNESVSTTCDIVVNYPNPNPEASSAPLRGVQPIISTLFALHIQHTSIEKERNPSQDCVSLSGGEGFLDQAASVTEDIHALIADSKPLTKERETYTQLYLIFATRQSNV